MISHWRALLAGRVLWSGGVIAYPTEAVWGIGCLPENLAGVRRIMELKGRSIDQGVILVAAEIGQFEPYLEHASQAARARLEAHWPGSVTYLVHHGGIAPDWISGGRDTVALRVSAHPIVQQLCDISGSPLVSTSANPSGRPPARDQVQLRKYFGGALDMIVPGPLGGNRHVSEIRDLATDQIVRAG